MADAVNESQLAISKDSWHFKYYCYIRSLWGASKTPEITSLCPYCQTMIWASLFAVALSPVIITGWIMLKCIRALYKVMERSGFNRAIDFFDETQFGKSLAVSGDAMKEMPIVTALVTFFMAGVGLAMVAIFVFVPCLALFLVATSLPQWPSAIWVAICWLCGGVVWLFWGAFHLFSWVGEGLYWAGFGINWFFTNGPMWLGIGYWTLVVLGASAQALLASYVFYLISKIEASKRLGNFILMKINGYSEAKAAAVKRRELAKEQAPKLPPKKPKEPSKAWLAVSEAFSRIFCKSIDVGGTAIKILTPFGVAWHMLLAFKHRACPLVQFVGDEEVTPPPEAEEPKEEERPPPEHEL